MEIGFTTVEIILGIYATVMATLLGLLVYFVTKELSNKELAKDIGTVKAHSESTEKILREVKTDVKALVSKVDKNTESLNSKVESVNDSVDKKS